MSTRTLFLLAVVCLLLGACQTAHAGPILAGIAGAGMALDQMLAQGVVTPEQHHALEGGIQALQQGVQAATEIAQQAKSGGLTPEGGAGLAAAISGAAAVGLNIWRNQTRKVVLATAPAASAASSAS